MRVPPAENSNMTSQPHGIRNRRRARHYLWAAPWSCVGLSVGGFALLSGGGWLTRHGVLEFHGGILPPILRRVPIAGGAAAITLGHTVLARTIADLDRCRAHEQVHVRQYEQWGLFFVPAYFWFSVRAWYLGQDPYRDNPFEREAYTMSD